MVPKCFWVSGWCHGLLSDWYSSRSNKSDELSSVCVFFRSDMGWAAGEGLRRHLSAMLCFERMRGTGCWKSLPCGVEVLLAGPFKTTQNPSKDTSVYKHMLGEKGNRWDLINLFHLYFSWAPFLFCVAPCLHAIYTYKGLSRRVTLPVFANVTPTSSWRDNDTGNSNSVNWGLWGDQSSGPEAAGLGKPVMNKNLLPGLSFWKRKDNKHWSPSFASLLMKLVRDLPGLWTCSNILFLWQRALG